MSGNVTELGKQTVVASVDLPTTKIPALNAAGTAVIVDGQTLVDAAASGAVPSFAAPETLAPGSQVTLTKNSDGTYTLGVPAGVAGDIGSTGPAPVLSGATSLPSGSEPTVTEVATGNYSLGIPVGETGAVADISTTAVPLASGSAPTAIISGPAAAPTITFGLPPGPAGPTGPAVGNGPFIYQGVFNASTGVGNPVLPTPASGNISYLWIVTVAGATLPSGTVLPDGITSAVVGDALVSNGSAYALIHGFLTPQAVTALAIAGLLTLPGRALRGGDNSLIAEPYADDEGWMTQWTAASGDRVINGLRIKSVRGGGQIWNQDGTVMLLGVDSTGTVTTGASAVTPGVTFETSAISTVGVYIKDDEGFVVPQYSGTGAFLPASSSGGGTTSDTFTAAQIAAYDAIVLARADLDNRNARTITHPIMSGAMGLYLLYGQSLAVGKEAYPVLSTTALTPVGATQGTITVYGASMVGDDILWAQTTP